MKDYIQVLLIDDDEDDFILTKSYIDDIRNYKIKLDWIANHDEALVEITKARHDLYLIDYRLGALSGIDLMRNAISLGCDRPIIILTGQGEGNVDLLAIQSGASDYLAKDQIDSYVLEKSILYAVERNNYKNELIQNQLKYKFLFEELQTKNQIINSILQSIPIVIARLEKSGEIIDIYGSGLNTLNRNIDDLKGIHIKDVFKESVFSLELIEKEGFWASESSIDHLDDFIYFSCYYFLNQEKKEIIFFGIDITEIKEVNIANQKLSRINELLDNIIYLAAHDLRSPISNLRLIAHLINDVDEVSEKLEMIAKINESVERMEQVINGLVEIIEVQKEGGDKPRKIVFEEVFEHVYANYEDKLLAVDGNITHDFSQAPYINYLEAFLISIFNNLIGNAIKYRSNRPLHISVETKKLHGFVFLIIKDNGIGIDLRKHGNRIFRPFSRISKHGEGKGIGLHLVKTIVEKNGGSIKVNSQPDQGTQFEILLSEY
ncbi:MAG: sensor histidine kinase [Candidatus Cyclobacteriaceae bacterium M3_2C_046]